MLVPTMRAGGRDDRGRHLLDEDRPGRDAAGDQSGGRFFGVAPGTNMETNPNAVLTLGANCIFTNTAFTDDGDVWWRVSRGAGPLHRLARRQVDAGGPNARCAPEFPLHRSCQQDPAIADEWEDPEGVPISAILFGGRRASVVPSSTRPSTGPRVFLGSIMASETTAAATGAVGELRRDRSAMLPFCGYNMADYWAHWLSLEDR